MNYLRNRKHVPCIVIETRAEVWENEKCYGNKGRRRVFPQLFRVLPNFHEFSQILTSVSIKQLDCELEISIAR